MREKHEKVLGDHTWQVTLFPATEGLKIFTRLLRLLGGPLGKAFAGVEAGTGNIMDVKVDFAAIGGGIKELAERLDEDEVVMLVKRLLADTRCDGKEIGKQFDLIFPRNYLTLLQVVMFVVEVNYQIPLSGFLGSLEGGEDSRADLTLA